MRKSKLTMILALILSVSFLLSGCSSSSKSTRKTTQDTEEETEDTEESETTPPVQPDGRAHV